MMAKRKTLEEWQFSADKLGKLEVVCLTVVKNKKYYCLVRCKTCSYEYEVLTGNLNKNGCRKCANQITPTTEEALQKLKNLHKNFIFKEFEYKNCYTRVPYTCTVCGFENESSYTNLIYGKCGCPKCNNTYKPTSAEAIGILNAKHPDLTFTPFVYTTRKMPITYNCKICSKQSTSNYDALVFQGSGCPLCNLSRLENKTSQIIEKCEIKYNTQHRFTNCKNKRELPFDFFIPSLNMCIECQGIQHFRVVSHFNGKIGFNERVRNDAIKLNFCKNNNIALLYVIDRGSSTYKDVYKNTIFIDELEPLLKTLI